jgi:hypothetical protein
VQEFVGLGPQPSVRHRDVDAPETLAAELERALDFRGPAHIRAHAHGTLAPGLRCDVLFELVRARSADEHESRSFGRKTVAQRPPDSARRSGDEHHFV